MNGCRALSDQEIESVKAKIMGAHELRDKALFILGVRTGFRIAELLSIKVGDVMRNGEIVERLNVSKRNIKNKSASRSVKLHWQAGEALKAWINTLGEVDPNTYLFLSDKGKNKPITRQHAWRVLDSAFAAAGITGNTGTHMMRKTFAHRVYMNTGKSLLAVKRVLGHKDLESTARYLGFLEDEEIDQAVLSA